MKYIRVSMWISRYSIVITSEWFTRVTCAVSYNDIHVMVCVIMNIARLSRYSHGQNSCRKWSFEPLLTWTWMVTWFRRSRRNSKRVREDDFACEYAYCANNRIPGLIDVPLCRYNYLYVHLKEWKKYKGYSLNCSFLKRKFDAFFSTFLRVII